MVEEEEEGCVDVGPEEVPCDGSEDRGPEEVPSKAAASWCSSSPVDYDGAAAGDGEDGVATLGKPEEEAEDLRKLLKKRNSVLEPHLIEPEYYYLPDYCDNCGGVLIGNGFRCRGPCGFKIHRGLGKGTENCHADVLLTMCEPRAGHAHVWETGDLAKQIARNTHQAVKDTVVEATVAEQKDWGKFDRLTEWAKFVREHWDEDDVVAVVLKAQAAGCLGLYALGYVLIRCFRVTRGSKTPVYLQLAGFSAAIAALAFLCISTLLLYATQVAAVLGLRYSAWGHVFVDEMIHVRLEDCRVDLASSFRSLRAVAERLVKINAIATGLAFAHWLYHLNVIAL